MAMNTPDWQQQYTASTTALAGQTAKEGVFVVDTSKFTGVVMDGTTAGGHPLAKESRKIKAGTPNVKINDGTEATLAGDITITVLPGTVPGGMVVVTNPEGKDPGEYLEVSYTDTDGAAQKYYVSLNKLVDKYLAGAGIKIDGNTISVDAATLVGAIAKPGEGLAVDEDGNLIVSPGQLVAPEGSGLKVDENGKLMVDLTQLVATDPNSPLQIVDGKITLGSLISADAGNNLKEGSDKKVYYPANLGTL